MSDDLCECRKPNAESILKIVETYHLQKENTFFIGDSPTDMEAGQRAGIKTIPLQTGNKKMAAYLKETNQVFYEDLEAAVNFILNSDCDATTSN